jgi:hypothetical protein
MARRKGLSQRAPGLLKEPRMSRDLIIAPSILAADFANLGPMSPLSTPPARTGSTST